MTASPSPRRATAAADPDSPGEFTMSTDDFRRIKQMIHADSGIALSEGKAALVYARLAKRLRTLKMQAFREYCDLVSRPEGASERQEMLTALTTNVTKFFRESHHFDHLVSRVLAPIFASGARGARARLWSAACSTGQEPYSIAIALLSRWPEAASADVKILATDIDRNVLATAEAGVYAQSLLEGVGPDHRRRFFEPAGSESNFRVVPQVRGMVSFRPLNLLENWPMKGRFDAIFCRNVVIYFDEPTQQTLWEKFLPRLAPTGALYIGHSERVSGPASERLRSDGVSTYRVVDGDVK